MPRRTLRIALVIISVGIFDSVAFPFERFIRGDADASGEIEITDSIRILEFLFLGPPLGLPCLEAADADNDGLVNITDPVRLLEFQFTNAHPTIPPPFPNCGSDTIFPERLPYYSLGCESFGFCDNVPYSFYGNEYFPEAVFFVADGSRPVPAFGNELAVFLNETVRNILGFKDGVEFGIFLFDSTGVVRVPEENIPIVANEKSIRETVEWLLPIDWSISSLSCPREALLAALYTAENSTASKKSIFFLARGGAHCDNTLEPIREQEYLEETIEVITQENDGIASIHTIAAGDSGSVSPLWINFLKRLAELNGGIYTFILR